jgi:hypothetical protein
VLSLGSRLEPIFARTLRRAAQPYLSDPTRQRAVGYVKIIVAGEQLLDAHDVAARPSEGVLECGQGLRVAGRRRRRFAPVLAQDAAHGVTRELQQAADLAQAPALRFENVHAVADLREGLDRHTA